MNRNQQGLSMVELLVALIVSMVLMTGVVQVFFSSKQTYASNEAASRLQENGRFALEFIAQSARHAGYVEAANATALAPAPIAMPNGANCSTPGVCSTQGAGNASDTIGFAFQPRVLDGLRRDCAGNQVSGSNANTDLIINHFSIIPATGTTPAALGCRAWNFTSGAWVSNAGVSRLIDGVDAMQIQYGVSSGSDRNNVSQYISADRVTALGKWSDVLAVRIAVLANTVDPVTPRPPARQYVLLDAPPLLIDDGRARQVFTTTVKLRNTF